MQNPVSMISVEEAEVLIEENKKNIFPGSIEKVPLEKSRGHILAENIGAKRDAPPFHRVCMDGIAISCDAWESGIRDFPLQGVQGAGRPQMQLKNPLHALEVMTGAPLPEGCDGVIPYEQLDLLPSVAKVRTDHFNKMQNVQAAASEHCLGDRLLSKGIVLRSVHIGVIASQGLEKVSVYKKPSIAVISTGDELVDFHCAPKNYQIWRSNPWAIKAELESWGAQEVELFHLPDEKKIIYQSLSSILQKFSLVIISGGVSKGKFDFIPEVLGELGVRKIFHQVRQRPGLPLWFGVTDGQMVFGLPGNPCSSLITLRRYVVPLLCPKSFSWGICAEEILFEKNLSLFMPVVIEGDQVIPRPTKGSGDFGSLGESDGFIELPAERSLFPPGERVKFFHWGGNQ